MSKDYDEHDMINEGDTPEELMEHHDDAEEHDHLEQEKAVKAKKQKIMIWGGFAVCALAVTGYRLLTPTTPKSIPMSQNVNMAPPVNTASLPNMAPVGQPSSNVDLKNQVGSNIPQPQNGVPPSVNGAVNAQGSAGIDNVNAPSSAVVNNSSAMPSATEQPNTQSDVSSAKNVPMNSGNGTENFNGNNSLATNGASAVMQNAKNDVQNKKTTEAVVDNNVKEGFSRGMDELGKKLDDLKGMFAKFDDLNIGDRLAKLESRVAALEGGKSLVSSPHLNPPAVHHVNRITRVPQSITPIGEKEDLLFARINEQKDESLSQGSKRKLPEQKNFIAPIVNRGYSLHAVIPGRIWIKNADGNSQTFEAGESLPDGAKILKIDPDHGDVVTSSGVLRFDVK